MHKIQAVEKNHELTTQIKGYQKYLLIATGISFIVALLFPIFYLITRDRTLFEISIPITILAIFIIASLVASTVFIKRNFDLEADLRNQFIQAIETKENTFASLVHSKQFGSFCIQRKKQIEEYLSHFYSLQGTINHYTDTLSQNRQKLEDITQKIAKRKQEITEITQRTKTETPEELNQKLQELDNLEKTLDNLNAKLSVFARASLNLFLQYNTQSLLNNATEKIRDLSQYEPYYEESFQPNSSEEQRLREDLENMNKIIQNLESKKQQQESKFDQIFGLIAEITHIISKLDETMKLSLDLKSHIEFKYIEAEEKQIINSIPFAKQTLEICKSMMHKILQESNTAIEVFQILDIILQDEQAKRKNFLMKSDFHTYFKKITTINLINIEPQTNPKSKEFLCLEYNNSPDPSTITEKNLGTASNHQIYLCLSLMIMEKYHEQEPGFLILDNPFLGADDERAIKIVELLNEFRNKGWQLLITVNTERDFNNCINGFPDANIKKFEINNFTITTIM